MSATLLDVLGSPQTAAGLTEPDWLERGRGVELLERLLPDGLERFLVRCGLLVSMLGALLGLLVAAAVATDRVPFVPEPAGPIEFPSEPLWVLLLACVWIVVGGANAVALALSLTGRHVRAMAIATYAVLVSLVAGGLLNTYVSQLGALSGVVVQLGLLLLILDQRRRLAEPTVARDPGDHRATA